jgi:hypothetical protein
MQVDLVPFLLVLVLSVCLPGRAARLLRFVERPLGRIAKSRIVAITLSGLTAFSCSAAMALFGEFPEPAVQDEFSYLLAADTFAHGRVSNPTHPLWVHFESMHILQQPAYVSKYPPAQGLMLALGQVLTGRPIVGAWLSGALASSAICWMLLAWVRPKWALLGGLIVGLHPVMLMWSRGYWGGAVAVCGGALLLGGWRRLSVRPHVGDSILTSLGMALLANTRPFEGLVLTLLSAACFLVATLQWNRSTLLMALRRIVLPIFAVLSITAVGMGYYNWRITGHPLQMPYTVHEETYAVAPPFLWQAPRPEPTYRHKALHDSHADWELSFYVQQRSLAGFLAGCLAKMQTFFQAYFSLLICQVSLVAFPLLVRDQRMRSELWILGLFTLALISETWMHPHYAAPIAGLVFLVVVQALRHLRLWRCQGRPAGKLLVRASLLVSVVLLTRFCVYMSDIKSVTWAVHRARILDELTHLEGRHLVLVHYRPDHIQHAEWVYNEADIDNARVVWAREMEPEQNHLLSEYFKDRHQWLLDADAELPTLLRYVPGQDSLRDRVILR